MGEAKRCIPKAAMAALCAVLLAVTGALAYFATSSGMLRNLFSLGEVRHEVLVEVVDRAPGDGSATFTRISWNSNQLTVTDDSGKATAVPVYSGNFASKGDIGATEGVAGMGLAPDAYMYLPDTYSADELEAMFVGRNITFSSSDPAGGLNRTGTWNVGSIEPAANPDPQTSGGITYVKYVLKLGWPVERFDEADLGSVPDMLHVPERASYSFLNWTDCELVDGSFAHDGATYALYRTQSTWMAAADDAEVRVMWCTGDVLGSNVTFTRVKYGECYLDIVDPEGKKTRYPISSIGNDGTTDSPDAFAYLPESWTEEYAQSLLNGARATFVNSAVPIDPGYVVNVYKVLPEDNFKNCVKYKIRLTNWPETTIKQSQLGRLDKVAPLVPTRDGYRFSGWSEATLIGEGLYLTVAQWEKLADDDPNNMALPAYAALYGDTLVFGRGDTVPADYQGQALVQSWRGIEVDRYDVDSVPWAAYKGAIENVAMRAKIRPVSTANWFSWCANLASVDLERLDTIMTDDATDMFRGSTALQVLDLSSFDTQSMAKVDGMFAGCTSLARILVSTAWTNAPMTSSTDMFAGCVTLVGGNGYRYDDASTDAAVAVIDTDVNFGYLTQAADAAYAAVYEGGTMVFGRGSEIPATYGTSALLEGFRDIEVATYTGDTQPWRRYAADIEQVRFIAEIHPASTAYWFNSMVKLSSLSGLGLLDLSETANGQYMFGYCQSLDGRFDMGAFDTHNMVYWAGMFHGCTSLTEVTFGTDAHQFDSCEGIGNLFNGCTSLETVTFPKGADFTRLQRMNFTFADCKSLEVLDLSMFETPSLLRINNCFMGCANLRAVYATEGFSVANVTEEASQANVFADVDRLIGGHGFYYKGSGVTWRAARVNTGSKEGFFTEVAKGEAVGERLWGALWSDGTFVLDYVEGVPEWHDDQGLVDWWSFDFLLRLGASEQGSNTFYINRLYDSDRMALSIKKAVCADSCEGLELSSMYRLFRGAENLKTADLSKVSVPNDVWNLQDLFASCGSLESVSMPSLHEVDEHASLSRYDKTATARVFSGCRNLQSVDVSHWTGDFFFRGGYDSLFYNCPNLLTVYATDDLSIKAVSDAGEDYMLFHMTDRLASSRATYADYTAEYEAAADSAAKAAVSTKYARTDNVDPSGLLTYKAFAGPRLWGTLYDDGLFELSYGTEAAHRDGVAVVRDFDLDDYRKGGTFNPFGPEQFYVDGHAYNDDFVEVTCHESAEGLAVSNLTAMFRTCGNLVKADLSRLVLPQYSGCAAYIFQECPKLESAVMFKTSSETRLGERSTAALFSECTSLVTVDVSGWSEGTVVSRLFWDCPALTTVYAAKGSGFELDSMRSSKDFVDAFVKCPSLVGGYGTLWSEYREAFDAVADDDVEGAVAVTESYLRVDGEDQKGLLTYDVGEGPVDPSDPIGALMEGMTLHEKVCQMFCVYPENLTADSGGGSLTAMGSTQAATLSAYPFGGVCLFGANIVTESQTKALTDGLQAASALPMLVAVDEEGGRVQRIGGTTYDGTKRGAGIGFQLDAMQTYEALGEATARGNAQKLADNCKRVGCNWDFAPVADVNSNPSNPIIGMRAYSSDYGVASDLISAAIEGFHDEGVLTSIKHFPGHGDTSTDTHVNAAQVDKDLETLLAEDLVPFKAGIAAGADSVMVGHLMVPELDADNVATVSPYILQDVLRGQLGFDGVIVTDGMQMGALTNVYGKTKQGYIDAVLACLDAGVDVFLLPGYPAASADAIEAKVASGEISEERIDESCRRILEMKASIGLLDEVLAERGLS